MKRKFWNWIKNDAGGEEERTLVLNGEISDETWYGDEVTPALFAKELNAGSGNITVWINSPGGDVFAAAQIYNMLMEYKGNVTVKVDALAASAASVMYLAGNGSQKIKKRLEKDGDLTAMGKSLWHYATISHILKNRLYCGELEYRKEYVPDYLEQKRAKNNGELDRIIVEGKHQPIVTKEEFERVQRMLEEKNAQTAQWRKNKGVHSDDLWRRKLRCQCGHAFAKTRWHSKSRDFTTYTYKCYDQTRTGTIPARLKNGLSIEGVCRSPLVQDWKIHTMAQKVLHAVFDVKRGCAPYAEWLGQKENPQGKGWAAGEKYGEKYGEKILSILKAIVSEGKVQFMESLTLSAPYMVRVSIPDLNIRKGPGTDFPKTGKFTGVGIFTVVEEQDGWGLLKAYAEKRDGWISLAFTTRI